MSDQAISEREVTITTPDGKCDAHFAFPSSGPHPGILVWPDGLGLRNTFRNMGKRLAQAGYAVLTVNQFYRDTPAPAFADDASFSDPAVMQRLMGFLKGFTPETRTTDATTFVKWLDQQEEVDKTRKLGVTGYCMGGAFAIRTAAIAPDRVGACASFHGGQLVVDGPNSPHLLISKARAQFLVAVAQNDDAQEPTVKDTLRTAFKDAGLQVELEVYPAYHGWCPADMQSHNPEQAERAWGRGLALFSTAL